jgi:hypothetical protein
MAPSYHLVAGDSQQALMVAVHMQLSALEAAALPAVVLPPDVDQWFDQQLEAAKAALPPTLPHAALTAARQQQPQQRPGSPSLRQKRKWQASSPPAAASERQPAAAATEPAPQRSWASVVASVRAAAGQAAPAISRLPLWQHLKQRLAAEQQQEQGLRGLAVFAASGEERVVAPPPVEQPPLGIGGEDGSGYTLPLLQQLHQAASAERAATARLVQLALD